MKPEGVVYSAFETQNVVKMMVLLSLSSICHFIQVPIDGGSLGAMIHPRDMQPCLMVQQLSSSFLYPVVLILRSKIYLYLSIPFPFPSLHHVPIKEMIESTKIGMY